MKSLTLPAFAVLAICSAQGSAHHSASAYDREAPTSIEGTIVRYEWRNPHVYLWVEVEAETGADNVTWEIEGYPPAVLQRLGWSADEVSVGDRVTVGGFPGRDAGNRILLMESLTRPGRPDVSMRPRDMIAAMGQAAPPVTQKATSLAGTWVSISNPQTAAQFRPRLAASERGLAAIASYVEAAESPALECVPYTGPVFMMAPDVKAIEVRDDVVLIRGEEAVRTVHLNLVSHDDAVESIQGHSIGRWEGAALVIDTTHFASQRATMPGIGLPGGPGRHLSERLELNAEGTHLTYSFELSDPEYLSSTIAVTGIELAYRPDLEYAALPCDLDNARRFVD